MKLSATTGRHRAVIAHVSPQIDSGRFPIKRAVGESVTVEADVFTDGHDELRCVVRYRHRGERRWRETPMAPQVNDRWLGEFPVETLGQYQYTVIAWVDAFASWRHDLARRVDPIDIALALRLGAELIQAAAARARGKDAARLTQWADALTGTEPLTSRQASVKADELERLMARYADRHLANQYERVLTVTVDPPRARFGAWYELFPRSCMPQPDERLSSQNLKPARTTGEPQSTGQASDHGTFATCIEHLPYVADMGFDVLYLPPIHPIGREKRKGPNNALTAGPGDPGSPWAIGAAEGGHKSVHPALGTLADFHDLVARAAELKLEIALDIALQCAPDHPYVTEHPEWFRKRIDGSIQYAENPPKKYQDIYPFDFETEHWQALWAELKSIFEFWIDQGVRIFRVDNPHTKPFAFWEWLIGEIHAQHPDTIFLAEAFTRPKIMHSLAKLGFNQSYTYFTWRNTKRELTEYGEELAQGPGREYFRPNLWPNTPDILHAYLQHGGRPAFITRLVLAATLGANYGIYGPAFELCENTPREPGSEEYLDSEKYAVRVRDLQASHSLREIIARVNGIRREHPALQHDWSLRFHEIGNDQLLAYSKTHRRAPDDTEGASLHADGASRSAQTQPHDSWDVILVVVNLDPHHRQSGLLRLPLRDLGIDPAKPYQAHDLLNGPSYEWRGDTNYVELTPTGTVAHILHLQGGR